MKQCIKYKLSQIGLLPKLDLLRQLPALYRWIANGSTGIAPPPLKRMILSAYMRRFGPRQFIETGTYLGDTLAYIAYDKAVRCTSIELADRYYREAIHRFSSYSNVNLLHGNSGLLLPECIKELREPAMFWLDGHYSGNMTAKGNVDTPIRSELAAILNSKIQNHVVLIDDARCFTGACNYPCIDELLKIVREHEKYDIEVSIDIIRLTPKA